MFIYLDGQLPIMMKTQYADKTINMSHFIVQAIYESILFKYALKILTVDMKKRSMLH